MIGKDAEELAQNLTEIQRILRGYAVEMADC